MDFIINDNTLIAVILGLVMLSLWWPNRTWVSISLLTVAIGLAVINQHISLIGLLSLTGFFCLAGAVWFLRNRNADRSSWLIVIGTLFLLIFGLLLSVKVLPGINSVMLVEPHVLKPDSAPYSLQLNIGKIITGIVLLIVFINRSGLLSNWRAVVSNAFVVALLCAAVIFPISTFSGYTHWQWQIPSIAIVWALHNILFTCIAEEVFFRGVIQHQLTQAFSKSTYAPFYAIGITATLFGLAHAGNIILLVTALISGMFIGVAYYRSQRLETAILTHFLINAIHFSFFSYPYSVL